MRITRRQLRQLIISEVTSLTPGVKSGFYDAMLQSKFWTHSNLIDDVDLVTDAEFSTPAGETLMDALNDEVARQNGDIYFLVEVSDEEMYSLGPDDVHGGYPDNWMMRGLYQGPKRGKHVIYIQLRPLSQDYRMEDMTPRDLVGKISRTINHELVHYHQLKKQAISKGISEEEAWAQLVKDKKQITQSEKRSDYLGLHNEIDAYAHEAAEELLDVYGPKKSLDLLRYQKLSELTPVMKDYIYNLKDDKRKLSRFLSKVHSQIQLAGEV